MSKKFKIVFLVCFLLFSQFTGLVGADEGTIPQTGETPRPIDKDLTKAFEEVYGGNGYLDDGTGYTDLSFVTSLKLQKVEGNDFVDIDGPLLLGSTYNFAF